VLPSPLATAPPADPRRPLPEDVSRQHDERTDLLRPLTDSTAQDAVRDLILDAYAAHEAEQLAANAGAIAAQVGL
jgi:hypothetical protein